ncbi:MAG: tetratricopeptide repeat protein [Bacteroidales bacterium]|nr:tetratricopeptide repeat protein [Bacteroidales bacterium]MCF8337003.1 tetratricopeptide repeat protein [Bacteroidales bacterium]
MNNLKIAFLLLTVIGLQAVYGQQTATYDNTYSLFQEGSELYEEQKYGAARETLSEYLRKSPRDAEHRAEAQYLKAMAAMKLGNKDAEHLLKKFIEKYPENSRAKRVYFQLALDRFANYDYFEARKNFDKVEPSFLSNEETLEYHFKYGYCLFRGRKYEEAQMQFSELMDIDHPYGVQSKYYYSHIAYQNANYQTALEGFNELKNDSTYGNLVSYYIVDIYFHQDKYRQLLEEAKPLMETINEDRKPELSYMIGIAHYRLSDYTKAIEHLKYYHKNTKKRISRKNHYQLGYTYFQTGNYEQAIEKFQNAAGDKKDTLTQNAQYHLGMCYIETGNKKFAGNAFQAAYKLPFNPSLREDALYNYVKISYESPYNPYNKAIDAVRKFRDEFPDSKHMDEINSFLVDIFLSSKDYASAIEAFKEINNKTDRLKKAYQKITYYYGIELYNNESYFKAIKHFKESLKHPYDQTLVAKARFWTGEAYTQHNDYELANQYFEKFLTTNGAYGLEIYPEAYYNQGYLWFSQKEYDKARDAFRKYVIGERNRRKTMKADANIRLGDCYFVNEEYDQALTYYDKAINLNARDTDYAMYQKALAFGGRGRFTKKILQLDNLLRKHKESAFRDDAEFEMGMTYLVKDKEREAIKRFKNVYEKYPSSSYVKRAYLKSGLIHYNLNENKQALDKLKSVAEDYPNTSEANEALSSIKSIYMDMNRVDDYFDYANNLEYAKVSASEQDSATYISAENLYMEGDCEQSTKEFSKYLDLYDNGAFATNAHFYRGQCHYRNKKYDKALEDYEYVLDQPQSEFTETSLVRASTILYENENYRKALDYYRQLTDIAEYQENIRKAWAGIMRIEHHIGHPEKAIKAGENLLKLSNVTEKLMREAHLIVGRSAMELEETTFARKSFEKVLEGSKSEKSAEAKFKLAKIDYIQGNYTEAESGILEMSENFGGYDDWLAKAFVLLADVYVKTGNLFQAKQTLQSIIDNYDGEELVEKARQKKEKIIQLEEKREQEKIKQEKQAEKEEQDVDNY